MTTRYEGKNPFDQNLSAGTKQAVQKLRAARAFQEAQADAHKATEESFKLSHLHGDEWKRHQQEQHGARREEAEVVTPVETRERLSIDQAEQDAADDKRFSWIRRQDQLLQIRDPEEFLRATRSWERRPQEVKETKETEEPTSAPWTGSRVWGGLTLALYIFVVLSMMAGNVLGGLILGVIGLPLWAIVAQIPSWMNFDGSSKGGGAV